MPKQPIKLLHPTNIQALIALSEAELEKMSDRECAAIIRLQLQLLRKKREIIDAEILEREEFLRVWQSLDTS